jgi:hypothetical protein
MEGGGDGDDDESYALRVILHISNTDILQLQYTQHPTDCLPKHSNIRASTCRDGGHDMREMFSVEKHFFKVHTIAGKGGGGGAPKHLLKKL